jgi:hypothetical protein
MEETHLRVPFPGCPGPMPPLSLQARYEARRLDGVLGPHERGRPHGRNAFTTSLFSRGGSRSTPATSPVPRPRHRHSKRRLPVQAPRAIGLTHDASMQPHGTLTSRSHAATIFWARIRGRSPRSNRMSNATVRILRDDPASLRGWARPYSHKSLSVIHVDSQTARLRFMLFNDSFGQPRLRGGCSALRRSAAFCTPGPQNHSDFGCFLRLGRTLNLRVVGSIPTRLTTLF